MKPSTTVQLALATLFLAGVATTARAQINPADMRSGCTMITAGSGTLETSLFNVPAGFNFVLTDFSFSPTGYPFPPAGGTWTVALWIRNWVLNSDVRWVSGAMWDNVGHEWPVHMNWSTGIVFPANEALRFGMSGGPYPASTVCWSGYLVPNTTSSVIPLPDDSQLAMRAAPNPSTKDVELSFDLAKRQSIVLGVFSVEGRRVRTLHRGSMEAGRHHVAWDGLDDRGQHVADGMYFARLEAKDGSRTTSFVRVK
jgi:flagellar hook capping protein FlgD